jgi:hypothetical protein
MERHDNGDSCIMRSFIDCTLDDDQAKVDEMGVACSTYLRETKYVQYFVAKCKEV